MTKAEFYFLLIIADEGWEKAMTYWWRYAPWEWIVKRNIELNRLAFDD